MVLEVSRHDGSVGPGPYSRGASRHGNANSCIDLPAAWLLHSLFRSKAYRSHTSGVATVEVVVATDEGCAVGTIVSTDDTPPNDRGYDESVSSSEPRLTGKVSITFWANGPDTVVPAIHAALERAIQAL